MHKNELILKGRCEQVERYAELESIKGYEELPLVKSRCWDVRRQTRIDMNHAFIAASKTKLFQITWSLGMLNQRERSTFRSRESTDFP